MITFQQQAPGTRSGGLLRMPSSAESHWSGEGRYAYPCPNSSAGTSTAAASQS
ncbi:hypothetical protein [Streptomyces sp. bgisy084]|uniref:hypothetical protein n=1 Tax=unclassified Streptomyces TaxID=2593676 RepID=UPI003D74E609